MNSSQRWLIPIVTVGALVAGCASQRGTSQSDTSIAEVTRARTLIEQAETSGARRYAATELEAAREKLALADEAVEEGETSAARMLAAEASADAELAVALAASGEAEDAADEVAAGIDSLRRESIRSSPGDSLPRQTAPRGNEPVGFR